MMPWRGGLVVVLGLMVGGCFFSAIQVASWTATGVSYVFSGKGLGDHALSLAMNQDCATWRVLKDEKVCVDYGGDFENSWDAMASTWEVPEPGTVDDSVLVAGNPDDPVTNIPSAPETPQLASNAETPARSGPAEPDGASAEANPADGTVLQGLPVPEWALARRSDTPWIKAAFAPSETSLASLVVHDEAVTHGDAQPVENTRPAKPAIYLVIGSFRQEVNARRLADRYSGIETAISKAELDGGVRYRLLAGPLDRASLATARLRLGDEGVRNAWAVRLCRGSLTPPPCRPVVQQALLP